MTVGLSKDLEKYYERRGNRIVFANGMSLNKLAWEMWERLGHKEIDPSVISRVLKGERLFKVGPLKVLGKILKVPKQQEDQLFETLCEEQVEKLGLKELFLQQKNKYFLELVEDNLKKINQIRGNGLPALAIEWSDIMCEQIRARLHSFANEVQKRHAMQMLASIIIEQQSALLDNSLVEDIKLSYPSMALELNKIADLLKNKNILGYAHYVWGNLFYLQGDYEHMLPHIKLAYSYIHDDQVLKNYKLKDLLVYYGSTKQEKEVKKLKTVILRKIEKFDDQALICELLEGIAVAEILLGRENEADQSLRRAWRHIEKMALQKSNLLEIRKIQVTRTQLMFEDKFRLKKNLIALERLGKDALETTNRHNFKRHGAQIEKLLYRILNGSGEDSIGALSYGD